MVGRPLILTRIFREGDYPREPQATVVGAGHPSFPKSDASFHAIVCLMLMVDVTGAHVASFLVVVDVGRHVCRLSPGRSALIAPPVTVEQPLPHRPLAPRWRFSAKGRAWPGSALFDLGPVGAAGGQVFRRSRHLAIVVGLATSRSPRCRGSRS